MTSLQRIIACAIAGLLWLAALIAKHFWSDLDIGSFCAACGAVITALGVHGATTGGSLGQLVSLTAAAAPPAPPAQGGFIRVRLLALIVAVALGLAMLFGCATAPNDSQVQAIKNACAVDAGVRPTVTMLLAVPGLAKPEEMAAVTAARAVIDPICANPAGTPQENAVAAVSGASATILGIVTQLQARKAQ